MNKKIILGTLTVILGFLAQVANVQAAVTCPEGSIRANKTVNSVAECNVPEDTGGGLMGTLKNIINVVIGVVGFVAVVMMIIGGISYTTSQGDSAKVKKAKDTIMYGIIGLVISMLSFAIVNFVLTNFFKS